MKEKGGIRVSPFEEGSHLISTLLACNFLLHSQICFRCWIWSLEDGRTCKILLNSETPNLPIAEATKVILSLCYSCTRRRLWACSASNITAFHRPETWQWLVGVSTKLTLWLPNKTSDACSAQHMEGGIDDEPIAMVSSKPLSYAWGLTWIASAIWSVGVWS